MKGRLLHVTNTDPKIGIDCTFIYTIILKFLKRSICLKEMQFRIMMFQIFKTTIDGESLKFDKARTYELNGKAFCE